MELMETNKLKRNRRRLKEYIWKNLKRWRSQEEKVGYRIFKKKS